MINKGSRIQGIILPEEDHYHQPAEDLKITHGAEFKALV